MGARIKAMSSSPPLKDSIISGHEPNLIALKALFSDSKWLYVTGQIRWQVIGRNPTLKAVSFTGVWLRQWCMTVISTIQATQTSKALFPGPIFEPKI